MQSVEPAALQPDVEEDEVRPARGDGRQRLVGGSRLAGAVALILKKAGDQIADVDFVVHHQDISAHRRIPFLIS
ncbi:hypothetical protein D3C86_2213920 [compost metagenome]